MQRWNNPAEPPKAFQRVWVKTECGKVATAYINSSGRWIFNCPKLEGTGLVIKGWCR